MNTLEQIYTAVKAALGTTYTVLSSYDATDAVNPQGTIAVNVGEFEHLDHAGCEDYRFNVTVSCFTLADEDKTRAIIYGMEAYILKCLDLEAIKGQIDGCAGAVMGHMTTQSDGDSNEATLTFDLYVCDVQWQATSSSSSAVDAPANGEG